ncbi:MAG: hypothetical protein ACTSYY_00440 [Promethearchaeota archaeon]
MPDFVKKYYYCRICQKNHAIKFPVDFAENQKRYPFVFFAIHKYSGNSDFDKEADIITTFYIDKNLTIRDVDVAWEESSTNIISEYDTTRLVGFLIDHINELQDAYDSLMEKYVKLQELSKKQTKKQKSPEKRKKTTEKAKTKKPVYS